MVIIRECAEYEESISKKELNLGEKMVVDWSSQ